MKTLFVAIRAVVYMTGFLLLWSWVALGVRVFDQNLGITLPGWVKTLGLVLMVVGGILALTCAGVFVTRGRGTPAPFDAPRQFVAIGPYRYVRNPMYLGALMVLSGLGLYERSASILLLSLVLIPVRCPVRRTGVKGTVWNDLQRVLCRRAEVGSQARR
jgi:protein-S-isoprenylcysteine O-methyltransferase Ste14